MPHCYTIITDSAYSRARHHQPHPRLSAEDRRCGPAPRHFSPGPATQFLILQNPEAIFPSPRPHQPLGETRLLLPSLFLPASLRGAALGTRHRNRLAKMRTLIWPRRGRVRLAACCCGCRSIAAAGVFLLRKARKFGDRRAVCSVLWSVVSDVRGMSDRMRRRHCLFITADAWSEEVLVGVGAKVPCGLELALTKTSGVPLCLHVSIQDTVLTTESTSLLCLKPWNERARLCLCTYCSFEKDRVLHSLTSMPSGHLGIASCTCTMWKKHYRCRKINHICWLPAIKSDLQEQTWQANLMFQCVGWNRGVIPELIWKMLYHDWLGSRFSIPAGLE